MIVFLFSLGESMQLAITTEYTLVDGISQIGMLLCIYINCISLLL